MPRFPSRVPASVPSPIRLLLFVALAAVAASPARAASIAWDGGGDGITWGSALNWSGDVVPTAADAVTIGPGYTVRVAATAAALSLDCDGTLQVQSNLSLASGSSVETLQHTSGTLTVTGDLTVGTSLVWSAGTMTGAGTTYLAPGATGSLATGAKTLLTRTFRNQGSIVWTGTTITLSTGAIIYNEPGATFDVAGDLTMSQSGTGNSLQNEGLLRRTTTAGTATVLVTFTNSVSGVVRGETGTMRFSKTLVNSGRFEFLPGTLLEIHSSDTGLINPKTFDATSSLVAETVNIGVGSNQFVMTVSGNYDVEHTILSFGNFGTQQLATTSGLYITHPDTLPRLTLGTPGKNARIDVAGDLRISETFLWQGYATMQGAGTTILPPGITATIASGSTTANDLTVDVGRTLRNETEAIWTDGVLRMLNGGLFHNAPNGTLEIRGDLTMEGSATGATTGSFRNSGLVRRTTTAGTATVLAAFGNDATGVVRGETGTMRFSKTLVNSGRFEFLPGTLLEIHSSDTGLINPKTFDATSSLVAETVNIGVGSNQFVMTVSGNYDVEHTILSFGNFGTQQLATTSGLYITHPDTLPRLTLGTPGKNARIDVAGDLRISNSLLWRGIASNMEGTGTTIIAPAATATIDGETTSTTRRLDTRHLRNEGVMSWVAGGVGVRNGSTVDNSGTFLVQGDATMSRTDGTVTHYFNNTGTLRREISAGTAQIDGGICFVNTGTVDVDTGTLLFSGCYPALTGTYSIASILKINNVPLPDCSEADITLETAAARILDAAGTNLVGHLDCIQPSGSITVQGGHNYVSDGPMANAGTLDIDRTGSATVNGAYSQTGTLSVEIGGRIPVTEYSQLSVAGTATFSGTLQVALVNGFTPSAGDSFHVVLYPSHTGTFTNLALPPLPPGLEWGIAYGATAATLYVKALDFTIVASAGSGGSIDPAGSSLILYGASAAYTITPDSCYQVADVLVNGASVGAVTEYTFADVQADHTIAATFALRQYMVTASAGTGGTIAPDGAVAVGCGADQAFTIAPATGYRIADVLVDGQSVGAVAAYSVPSTGANHTIEAVFALLSYTVTASAGPGGAISPDGATAVNHGASQSYAITPDSCYQVADVLVNGASVGAVTEYTFADVQADHTIAATFALRQYTVTTSAGTGGTIAPDGAVAVGCGADQAFTIAPATGYRIADVIVDGQSVGAVTGYTFPSTGVNHTIEAVFALLSYTVTASAGPGGAISPDGATAVNHGDDLSYTITPGAGYAVADVLVDGSSIGAVAAYTFSDVEATHTIAVTFVQDSPAEVTVHGVVTSDCGGALAGVTVDLLDAIGGFHTTATDGDGAYRFEGIPYSNQTGAGEVSIVIPLGYEAVTPGPAGEALTLDQDRQVNFLVACLDPTGAPRGIGYWKHNANVFLSGRGSAQESSVNMSTNYPQAVFNHFHENALNGIAVAGVTYIGAPPRPIDLATIGATLTVSRGGTSLDRARQHYLALLLNVASGKLFTASVVSQDGATVSQVLQFIADLILDGNAANDDLAANLGETVNNAQMIAGGVVPIALYGNIAYARGAGLGVQLRAMGNPSGPGPSEFRFGMPQAGQVEFTIFDVQGRRIAAPLSGQVAAGSHRIVWTGQTENGALAAAGFYFGRLTTPYGTRTVTFQRLRR
jgi:hypothetical protein